LFANTDLLPVLKGEALSYKYALYYLIYKIAMSQPISVEVFNMFASRYDSWYERNRITADNELRLVMRASYPLSQPCVEIGGGTGYFASRLGCLNLDPSVEMLRLSRRRGVESIQGYGEYPPLRYGGFGTVIIVVTICFVESPSAFLRRSSMLLREGGKLVLCIIPRDSSWGAFYEAKRDSPFYSIARFISRRDAMDLIRSSGLELSETLGILGYGPQDEPRHEDPGPDTGAHGFVCFVAYKR
jgi:SAM-dependent methyltransferase